MLQPAPGTSCWMPCGRSQGRYGGRCWAGSFLGGPLPSRNGCCLTFDGWPRARPRCLVGRRWCGSPPSCSGTRQSCASCDRGRSGEPWAGRCDERSCASGRETHSRAPQRPRWRLHAVSLIHKPDHGRRRTDVGHGASIYRDAPASSTKYRRLCAPDGGPDGTRPPSCGRGPNPSVYAEVLAPRTWA